MSEQHGDGKLGLKELVAMGVGGMVGGGIFSVLGLAIAQAGHAAPLAFILGGAIALVTGSSYAKLGLAFRSDGGSFTYLEHAFAHPNIAGLGGWLLLSGYVGTLALYAFTFGVYGAAMFGQASHQPAIQHLLESFILLLFLAVNLYGVKIAGNTEDVIVMVKVLILALFALVGIFYVRADYVLPLFNRSPLGVIMGAGLVFVAYEGFELIPNAVHETADARRDMPRAIMISVSVTIVIYVLVSLVAGGNLLPDEIARYKEYALAAAAKPFLGHAGFMLIGLAALLSAASAINATLFGTARLGMVMAREKALPTVFSHKERTKDIPWISLLSITGAALLFVNTTNLTILSAFASSTFLLIFAAINLSALRLHARIGIRYAPPLIGLLLCLASWLVLVGYLCSTDLPSLLWVGGFYIAVIVAELVFSERRCVAHPRCWLQRRSGQNRPD